MRHTLHMLGAALIAVVLVAGCRDDQPSGAQNAGGTSSSTRAPDLTLPMGTSVDITLNTPLTSETASVGDPWTGTIRSASVLNGRNVLAAGSAVSGTVTAVRPARKGDRAMLDLGLSSVTVGERRHNVSGGMESVVAGSTRARNLGAIGAAAVVGGVVGHAVGKSRTGTVVGGLVGAGVATGVVAASDGYQVVLKPGTPLTFTTSEALAVRY